MFEFWAKNRNLLALILGLLSAYTTVMVIETIGMYKYPPSDMIDFSKPDTIKNYILAAPFNALFFIIFAYGLGSMAGAYVATRVSLLDSLWPVYSTVAVFLLSAITHFMMMPYYPEWVVATTLPLTVLGGYVGNRMGKRNVRKR